MRLQVWMMAALLALAAGCYKRPEPNCAFRCGANDECPTGYSCNNGQCQLEGASECTALPADAMVTPPSDAPPIDAAPPPIDAPPPPPIDAAGPDAPEEAPDAA